MSGTVACKPLLWHVVYLSEANTVACTVRAGAKPELFGSVVYPQNYPQL